MCKRSQSRQDPLVDLFLTRYKVNLLPMPLETAECGQVYVQRPGATLGAVSGRIAELVIPDVTLPPIDSDRALPDLAGTRSSSVDVRFGLKLLRNFLIALGVGAGVIDNIHVGYEHSRARTVRFAFLDATRDEMDPFSLGTALIDRRFNEAHPWIGPGNSYFVSAAVIRSSSVHISAEDEHSNVVSLGTEVMTVAGADAALTLKEHDEGTVAYEGSKRLAIGVELYPLRYDEESQKFSIGEGEVAVKLRRGVEVDLQPSYLGAEDEAFVDVEVLEG